MITVKPLGYVLNLIGLMSVLKKMCSGRLKFPSVAKFILCLHSNSNSITRRFPLPSQHLSAFVSALSVRLYVIVSRNQIRHHAAFLKNAILTKKFEPRSPQFVTSILAFTGFPDTKNFPNSMFVS